MRMVNAIIMTCEQHVNTNHLAPHACRLVEPFCNPYKIPLESLSKPGNPIIKDPSTTLVPYRYMPKVLGQVLFQWVTSPKHNETPHSTKIITRAAQNPYTRSGTVDLSEGLWRSDLVSLVRASLALPKRQPPSLQVTPRSSQIFPDGSQDA